MIIVNIDVMLAKRKMSVTELSERVGITMANISILKNGKAKAIRVETLDKICKALDCQPGDILEYKSEDQICIIIVFNYSRCGSKELDAISNIIDLDIRDGDIITYQDNQGWFNDGITYVEVSFEDKQIEYNIKNNESWKELSVDDNGYYYFIDIQESNENILERSSYN